MYRSFIWVSRSMWKFPVLDRSFFQPIPSQCTSHGTPGEAEFDEWLPRSNAARAWRAASVDRRAASCHGCHGRQQRAWFANLPQLKSWQQHTGRCKTIRTWQLFHSRLQSYTIVFSELCQESLYMLVPLLKSQKSRDPSSNCLYPISNRTEIAAWFSSQIAIISCSGTRCQKKYETCAETAALIMKVLSKPNCYQLPTTAMSYNQSLSSLPPSASLADLNLFGALVSHQTSSICPIFTQWPRETTLLPCIPQRKSQEMGKNAVRRST
jgi:hypothetical protein